MEGWGAEEKGGSKREGLLANRTAPGGVPSRWIERRGLYNATDKYFFSANTQRGQCKKLEENPTQDTPTGDQGLQMSPKKHKKRSRGGKRGNKIGKKIDRRFAPKGSWGFFGAMREKTVYWIAHGPLFWLGGEKAVQGGLNDRRLLKRSHLGSRGEPREGGGGAIVLLRGFNGWVAEYEKP